MIEYKCTVCNKRVCDSSKALNIIELSKINADKADIIIKCKNCRNRIAVKVKRTTST